MKTISKPPRDAAADYDRCIDNTKDEADREALRQARRVTIPLFQEYEAGSWHFDRLSDLSGLSQVQRKALLKTYGLTQKRRPLSDLRAELILNAEGECPYCRLENPTTLDHFLPKSKFEPYASLYSNLIPMCNICNTLKGTKGSPTAHQFFTHAYFDEIAAGVRLLIAQVSVGSRQIATNFSPDFSCDLDESILQRLSYQFSMLRLGQRYQLAAIDVIKETAEIISGMHNDGASSQSIRELLSSNASDAMGNLGAGHWRALLLEALSQNVAFHVAGFKLVL